MSSLQPSTAVENIAGHELIEGAMTVIGALAGGPLAALLPVLTNSLANGRHKQRVENALADIDATLKTYSEELKHLSDSQYKIVNESILALLQAVDAQKIEYLKKAVTNSLKQDVFQPQEAVALSRIIRDISADEATFLVNNFNYRFVTIGQSSSVQQPGLLVIQAGTTEELVFIGLISLGLLVEGVPVIGGPSKMSFAPIVAKLLVLLR